MQIPLPAINLPDDFAQQVANLILSEIRRDFELQRLINELPPYPTRQEVMNVLKVGYTQVSTWIDEGLPLVRWSENKERFDRDDIKAFFNSRKM